MKKLSDKQLRKLYGIYYKEHKVGNITYRYSGSGPRRYSIWEKIKLFFERADKNLYDSDLPKL